MFKSGDRSNKNCNLECLQQQPTDLGVAVNEFVGPVKIVLVDVPASEYKKKYYLTTLVVLARMLVAVVVMTVFFFTLSYHVGLIASLHIILATAATQLFSANAILVFSSYSAFGGLKKDDNICDHMCLQISAFVFMLAGTIITWFLFKYTTHAALGVGATVLYGASVFSGVCPYVKGDGKISSVLKDLHRYIGLSTFLVASGCFITGLQKPIMKTWGSTDLMNFLIIFSVFYVIVIVLSVFFKE